MTKAALREAIKAEARLKSATNWDTLINQIVAEILFDHCNKERYYEVRLEDVAITLVDNQQKYDLPSDFQNIDSIRFGRGPMPTNPAYPIAYRELLPWTDVIARTYANGYPKDFRLVGNQISLWPYNTILAQDSLLLNYYYNPNSVFVDEDDEFPISRLESTVKKEAIARLQRVMVANPDSALTQQDAQASFNAAQSASGA